MAGKKKIIIIFSALGILLFLGFLLFQESEGEPPEQVYRNYITAQNESNCEEVVSYYSGQLLEDTGLENTENALQQCQELTENIEESTNETINSIETTTVDDNRAVLNVSSNISYGGTEEAQEESYEVTLIKENSSWLLE